MKSNIIAAFILGCIFSATITASYLLTRLMPVYSVSMPEELPAPGDVLFIENIQGTTYQLGYYQPQGEELTLFPNWQKADSLTGIEGRYSDLWCVAASGAVNSDSMYNYLLTQEVN